MSPGVAAWERMRLKAGRHWLILVYIATVVTVVLALALMDRWA